MNKLNQRLMIIAFVLSIVFASLFYSFLNGLGDNTSKKEYITIVVAKRDIQINEKITQSMLEEKKVEKNDYIPSDSQSKKEFIDLYAKESILEGEMIRKERLVKENEKELVNKIPIGMRAISVSVNEFAGVADLIKPNDFIDVYSSFDEKEEKTTAGVAYYTNLTKLILQNKKVLAISQKVVRDDEIREKIPTMYAVTLVVSPSEAERLIYAETYGDLKLVLRGRDDKDWGATYGVTEAGIRQ